MEIILVAGLVFWGWFFWRVVFKGEDRAMLHYRTPLGKDELRGFRWYWALWLLVFLVLLAFIVLGVAGAAR